MLRVVVDSAWRTTHDGAIASLMHGHKIWRKQCQATCTIRRRFGMKNALDYLVREKLLTFAEVAEQHPEFAAELPRFQAAAWEVFHAYELAGYLASLRPMTRKKLQKLLYVRSAARVAPARLPEPTCHLLPGPSDTALL